MAKTFLGGLAQGAANTAVGQGLGLLVNAVTGKQQEKQQERLTEQQIKAQAKMQNITNMQQLDMWNKTNLPAQVQHAKDAGLNVGLFYGGAGAGGTTGGGGAGVTGGTADGASERTGMGIQLATQLALQQAQVENIKADTEKKKAETAGTGATTAGTEFQNALNEKIGLARMWERYEWASDKLEIESQRANAEWEAFVAGGFKGKTFDDPNSPLAKALTAGFEKTVEELKQAKTNNEIGKAEQIIKEFEAGLAKQGISPSTPWYVKMVADLLEKVGLNPITEIKK